MKKYKPKSLSIVQHRALALAISATLSTQFHAEEPKKIAPVELQAQAENNYRVEQSFSLKYTQPLLDTAKSITVIPQAVMKDRGVESLSDALRNVSGISLAAGEGGTPTGDSMSIRGFSAHTDILADGIRDIAGYTRDTYNLESIEIAKGPGSAVSGRGSTGGSINLQSKAAHLENNHNLGLRLGTESDYRATVDSNYAINKTTAIRFNLLSDEGDVAGRDEVENSTQAGAISFATGLGSKLRFKVNAELQQQDNLPDYGLPWVSNSSSSDPVAELQPYEGKAPPVDYSNFYGNVNRDFEDIKARSLTPQLEWDLSDDSMLRLQGRTGYVERQSVVTAPRFQSLTTSTNVRLSDEKTRDTKDSLLAFQLDYITRFDTGSITHDVVTGVEHAKETFKRYNFIDLVDDNLDSTPEVIDLYHPNSNVAYTGSYGRDGSSTEAEGTSQALYAFDSITFNKHFELNLGARIESFKTDYQYDYTDPSLNISTSDTLFSWNMGLVYKPVAAGSVYFGVGNSYNPSAEGLTVSTSAQSNIKDLDPEESVSYELGTKWLLLNNRLGFNAALFRTEKKNARTDDPTGAGTSFDTLNGKQKVDGLELSASGQITPKLLLITSYTYQNSEVSHAEGADVNQIGMELAHTPAHSASLWSRYDINKKWAMGVGAQYVGTRYNSSDPNSRETADSYIIFDMMLAYQVNDRISLQLNGSNLSDESYEYQLGGGHFIPGAGRYFRLNAGYEF